MTGPAVAPELGDRQLRLPDGVLYDADPELAAAASALARS